MSPPGGGPAGPYRGELVDIGGRRLRLVRQGPPDLEPTVLFEAGSFGTAADWSVVQAKLGERMHSLAYDRAGLGYSDPGPEPRDSQAVVADLERLLVAAGERPPYVLVAHSMAPVHAYLFALRHRDWIGGMVLVDATPPDMLADPMMAGMAQTFAGLASLAPMTAALGLNHFAQPMGDDIGLPEPARSEKVATFVSARHSRWAALEARDWVKNSREARAAGPLSPDVPVAVVTAGSGPPAWKAMQAEPARRARHGSAQNVEGATHATLLGPRFAHHIVQAIDFVRAAAHA